MSSGHGHFLEVIILPPTPALGGGFISSLKISGQNEYVEINQFGIVLPLTEGPRRTWSRLQAQAWEQMPCFVTC